MGEHFAVDGAVEVDHRATAHKLMGAANELRAAAHLMAQGFDVFRAVGPHSAFDLVAHREGALYRVEVKTLGKPGRCNVAPLVNFPTNDEWDVLVLVGPDSIFQFRQPVSRHHDRTVIAAAFGGTPPPSPELAATAVLRRMVLDVFADDPTRTWSARELVPVLLSQGWEPGDLRPHAERVSAALMKLANQRRIEWESGHPRGRYRLVPPAEPT